jgi:flagellar FliL protein
MSAKAGAAEDTAEKPKGRKRKLLLLAVPVVLAGIGAGLWFSGILPGLLGMGPKPEQHAEAPGDGHGAAPGAGGHGGGHGAAPAAAPPAGGKPPIFFDMPEIVANLNAGPRRQSYVKLKPRLELARAEDEAAVRAALPRLMDLFQTYLREMRPEELRGSAGTYRLREELLARANIALAPIRVVDVLFPELLVQ